MVWEPEINELNRRRQLAEQMGGEEAVSKHHARGKLTVRERIAALADAGSFQEIGDLAGIGTYENNELVGFMPANTVLGTCTLDGRRVVVDGGDFTVRGGSSADADLANKAHYAEGLAVDWHLPYIRLLDAAGGSIGGAEQMGWTVLPGAPAPGSRSPYLTVSLLTTVPVVSAVLGSVAGWPAVAASLSHFSVMVEGTSQLFVGGPPVVKAALMYDIDKNDLGGAKVHGSSGAIDNIAKSEEEAFAMIRRFLSYMPTNVWEMPPRVEPTDDPNRRDEELLSVVPRAGNKPYDAYEILNRVLDHGSFFEITPLYGRSRITGLARVNGYPVGVMINNPKHMGGSMTVAACEKVIRFLQMCDTFHLPMVYFVDEPGFMIGLDSEKEGMVRAGARALYVTGQTRMPWISFVIRQVFGVAGAIHVRAQGMCERHSWPSGKWGPMHIEGGAMAAYRREIEALNTPEAREAKRLEIEERLKAIASPFRTAEHFGVENIIDPRDTRPILCHFIDGAQEMLKTQLGPGSGPSFRP